MHSHLSGYEHSNDISLDLLCKRLLTSAHQSNLTSKGLGQELLLSYLAEWSICYYLEMFKFNMSYSVHSNYELLIILIW